MKERVDFVKAEWLVFRWWVRRKLASLARAVVWKLPRLVIAWAGTRIWIHATTGPYIGTKVSEVTVDTALRRWDAITMRRDLC